MTVIVFGLDALDPDLVDESSHPNLTLSAHSRIESINSTATDEPSTHELWPTIITGLPPAEHGLQLEEGITWENPLFNVGSTIAAAILPSGIRGRLGAWLLETTEEAAFRTPATYYADESLPTLFNNHDAKTIGIPNYVVDPDEEDREHELRRDLGELFRHDPSRKDKHKHTSSDPHEFYHLCLEMSMIRIARTRRALRRLCIQ